MMRHPTCSARAHACLHMVVSSVAVLLLAAAGLSAQTTKPPFVKNDQVVLTVPTILASISYTGLLGMNRKFDIEAREVDGRLEVKDSLAKHDVRWRRDWRTAGFPSLL